MINLRYIGRLAALAFLVIGLFAFGLEIEDGLLRVNWPDVLGVFIVFVLADLGVALAVQAEEVRRSVTEAANKANESATSLTTLTKSSSSAMELLQAAKEQIRSSTRKMGVVSAALESGVTSLQVTGELHNSGWEFFRRTSLPWEKTAKYIRAFLNCWEGVGPAEPVGPSGGSPSLLLESAMRSLCDCEVGAVKSRPGEVIFVAADSTYCKISEDWLEEVSSTHTGEIVVRAISTLLPTEFALPGVWWGSGSRVATLERFVEEVIRVCGGGIAKEYSRLTLIVDPEPPWNEYAKSVPREAFRAYMEDIEGIVLWDRRLATSPVFQEMNDMDQELIIKRAGIEVSSAREDLEWEYSGIFKINEGHRGKAFYFPSRGDGGRRRREFFFLLGAPFSTLEDLVARILVGAKKAFWRPESPYIPRKWPSFEDAMRFCGIIPLRRWYTKELHSGDGRWLRLREDADVRSFTAQWDEQFAWFVFDLLLLGIRQQGGDEDDVRWVGALQSDLDLSDPSCMVRAVTSKTRLEDISKTVQGLFDESFDGGEGGSW